LWTATLYPVEITSGQNFGGDSRQSRPRMFPLQGCQLLAKSQVFKKECATSAEKAKDRTYQEHERVCHARVLSHFACGRQLCILLKSQADRILANDTSTENRVFRK
jgi:hypothetical protein